MSQVHALIAVKDLARAKSRLAPRFARGDRERLVLAMLTDTVTAALSVPRVASVTVVTPDPIVADTALAAGAELYPEPTLRLPDADIERLNEALAHAAKHVRLRHGGVDLLALQADLPALQGRELAAAIGAAPRGRRSYVVDHRGTGTSALLLRDPVGQLAPRFGRESAVRHEETGAVALRGEWPGLRLDVDTADDLELAIALGVGVATSGVLDEIGWVRACAGESSC
jgi:2-phospho-L-lactate/phosphoenolpyruvate guanylyltransferase